MQKMPRFIEGEIVAQKGKVTISKGTHPSPYSARGFSNILQFTLPGWSSAKDYVERWSLAQNVNWLLRDRYRVEKDGWQWAPHINDINELLEEFPAD